MQKSRLGECSYTILLGISVAVFALLWQFGGLKEHRPDELSHFLQDATDDLFSWIVFEKSVESVSAEVSGFDAESGSEGLPGPGEMRVEIVETNGAESGTISGNLASTVSGNLANTVSGNRLYTISGNVITTVSGNLANTVSGNIMNDGSSSGRDTEGTPEFYHADVSYFDDALFIGDSRTVGLYEYGGLGNAEVFAHSGMSIYKVFKEDFELRNGQKSKLEAALKTKQFRKVYIMLGINELGYDFEQTVNRFSEAIAQIQELQPQAVVFIQANMHITNKKSEASDLFNNKNINQFNQAVSELADGKKIFYLDVNPLYDDENGGLSEEYTSDHAHILGKHYAQWVEFILQNAVRIKED